jgi:hypothetical protein
VRNHGAIAVGILALTAGIAASGCGESSNAEAESLSVTTTKQVETQPRTRPVLDIWHFRAAFEKAYGTPPNRMPWYGLITGMKMNGTSLVVTTKLPPSSAWDGKEGTWGDAGTICGAAVGVAVDLGLKNADTRKKSAIEGVFMVGSGVGLGSCA